jgi:ribosomal peptide maturation radical SAM protein 1
MYSGGTKLTQELGGRLAPSGLWAVQGIDGNTGNRDAALWSWQFPLRNNHDVPGFPPLHSQGNGRLGKEQAVFAKKLARVDQAMSHQKMQLPVLAGSGANAADRDALPACNQLTRDVSGPGAAGFAPFRVALVSMPFGMEETTPSIQLGLLRAIAEGAGFTTDTYHLYLDLATRIAPDVYSAICVHRGHMTGEWLFAVAAFGTQAQRPDKEYFSAFPDVAEWFQKSGKDTAYLSSLRHEILPQYIADCLALVSWADYQVVGFSSSYQQQAASLALARRIKTLYPGVKIVFGGANLEGEMGPEHVRAFPFIDYAVVGEGDVVFPALLRCLAGGQDPGGLQGVASRGPRGVRFSGQAAPVHHLDALPVPNYDEYFQRARRLGLLKPSQVPESLPFESSRGCWWGAKHHCTFCGLNGQGMGYRAKSPERVFAELAELARRYRVHSFSAVDNILDMKYIKEVFASLEESKTDYEFFYEVKTNLTREQIRTLYRGGVRRLQPGIESLSSHVLQLMRKGATMLQNVRTLKWCRYYGITVDWNLIYGFPGETEDDYRQELEVLERLGHLQPPFGCYSIWLERFAPYYADRAGFPVRDVRPERSYWYVYPRHVDLEKIAYFFDYSMGETTPEEVHQPTQELVARWRQRWDSEQRPGLVYRRMPDAVLIYDHRGSGPGQLHTCRGPWAVVYELCGESMRTARQVAEHLHSGPAGLALSETLVTAGLEDLCAKGLMLGEDGQYLSLALPMNPNW